MELTKGKIVAGEKLSAGGGFSFTVETPDTRAQITMGEEVVTLSLGWAELERLARLRHFIISRPHLMKQKTFSDSVEILKRIIA